MRDGVSELCAAVIAVLALPLVPSADTGDCRSKSKSDGIIALRDMSIRRSDSESGNCSLCFVFASSSPEDMLKIFYKILI